MRAGQTRARHRNGGARTIARSGADGWRIGAAALGLLALAGAASFPLAARAAGAQDQNVQTRQSPERTILFSPVGSYLAGRIAQNAGDWSAAARHLTTALKADPENAGLLRRTFLLHLGEGNYDQALELAARMSDSGTDSFLADTVLIARALQDGQLDRARDLAGTLPTDGLGQFVTPLLSAWVDVAAGDHDAALAGLAPLDKAAGFHPLRVLQSALIEDLRGNAAMAEQLYAQAGQAGRPLRLLQLTGNFLERQGMTDAARALYAGHGDGNGDRETFADALARLDKGKVPAPIVADAADGLAEAMFDLASALHQEGAEEMALLYGRVALMLKPDMPLARLMVGDVLAARERHDVALLEYREVTQPGTVAWTAKLRQADALRRLDRGAEAAKLLSAMAAERPERTDVLIRLGDIERMAERYEAAIAAYDRAVERQGNGGRGDWIAHYVRALALDAAKRWPEAEADLRRALELNPDHPSVLNYLGYSYVDRGQNLKEAMEMIERAVAQRPNDGYIVDSLGWARYKLGDFHGAIEQLERAVELQPTDPTINDHLGDAYWAVGRKQEARFQWSRAVNLGGDDENLRAAAAEKLKNGLPLPKTAGLPGEE